MAMLCDVGTVMVLAGDSNCAVCLRTFKIPPIVRESYALLNIYFCCEVQDQHLVGERHIYRLYARDSLDLQTCPEIMLPVRT